MIINFNQIKYYNEKITNENKIASNNLIVPIFLNSDSDKEIDSFEILKEILLYDKYVWGYLIFINKYTEFSYDILLKLRCKMNDSIPISNGKILFGEGNPSKTC